MAAGRRPPRRGLGADGRVDPAVRCGLSGVVEFSAAAEKYDRFMGRYTRTLAPRLVEAGAVRAGMRALDVGCGPGGLTATLADMVGEPQVAAIDPAPQFVAACRERNPA